MTGIIDSNHSTILINMLYRYMKKVNFSTIKKNFNKEEVTNIIKNADLKKVSKHIKISIILIRKRYYMMLKMFFYIRKTITKIIKRGK